MTSDWRKSSYSGGMNNACVEVATSGWRKPSYSAGMSNNCVEVATSDAVLVRDTTDRDGVTLTVPASAWSTFTSTIK